MIQDNLHIPVLLEQSISALNIQPSGVYVDATFGRGGHSQLILQKLNANGRLLVIDQDPTALAHAHQLADSDSRITVCCGNFSNLQSFAATNKISQIDGILFDLGVSSPQLDTAERGFSFNKDGPLDMRMDNSVASKMLSAKDWIKTASSDEISNILWTYGEEKYAKKIARDIVAARNTKEIATTLELAEIIRDAHPSWPKNKHPATKSFMAIRLFINQELEVLTQGLEQAVELLATNGRLVVISFHSLEDRIVKQFFKKLSDMRNSASDSILSKLPVTDMELLDLQNKTLKLKDVQKPIKAGIIEGDVNIRARSAILRVATKI